MMMPPAGSMLKVSGRSIATVAAGPSPGRMPTTVPRKQPTKHHRRLAGCRATEKPCRRPLTTSISEPEQPDGEGNTEGHRKGELESGHDGDRRDRSGHERASEHDRDDEERQQRKAQQETEGLEQRDREREGEPGAH